jgi:uncharacterized membrane protein YraQ (UPF0718 family)
MKQKFIKWGILFSFIILLIDFVYKTVYGITLQTREACVLYTTFPKWMFLVYEFFIELSLVVIAGIFIAFLLEKYFVRFKRFYPQNQFNAFLYASLIPVCSCSVLPIIELMKQKLKFRTIITFVVAAPLLNPQIIVMSFSILGYKYALLRILTSFILAYFAGITLEYFYRKLGKPEIGILHQCDVSNGCFTSYDDLFVKTYNMFKRILPYLLLAGGLALVVELFEPIQYFKHTNMLKNYLSVPMAIMIGIPLYFCNGADIILLKPFLSYMGLPFGTAMVFSLTSTSVCITSLVMIIKFIGKKLTFILLFYVFAVTTLIGYSINFMI